MTDSYENFCTILFILGLNKTHLNNMLYYVYYIIYSILCILYNILYCSLTLSFLREERVLFSVLVSS